MSWLVLDTNRYQTFSDYTAAASDIDGVVIRCGLRGYSTGTLTKDSKLDTHYNGFFGKTSKGGISLRVGYYWYTSAISNDEAIEEAEYIDTIIGSKHNDFPVFINTEYGTEEHDGRADQLTAEERTEYLITLVNRLRDLNYRVGVFCTEDWINNNLVLEDIKSDSMNIWLASDTMPEVEDFAGWRYTTNGSISGISSRVSLSNFYKDIANWADTRININTLESWIVTPVTYNGTMETPTTVGIEGLTYLADYTVKYCNASTAGTLSYALLEGINNYTGTKNVPYTIEPATITTLGIQLSATGFRYTGEEIRPTITYDMSTDLGRSFSSSQYDIVYTNNINPGEATAKITGKNNYKDSVTLHFYIEGEIPFPATPTLDSFNNTYTGSEITPKVIIGTLVEDQDFTVEYENNIDVGIGIAKIYGKNTYSGQSAMLEFNINPLDLSSTANVRYSASRYIYTGSEITPTFTLTASLRDTIYYLEPDTDYTYSYSNNINAGKGIVTIVGKGNYTGTYYSKFTISPCSMSDCRVALEHNVYEYTGMPIEPEVFVYFNGIEMPDTDYNIMYSNNIKVGTDAMVTVTGKNNITGQTKLMFEISTKSSEDVWILDETDFVYSGSPYEPEPICVTSDPVYGRDYTVDYENNINAGTGKCTVTMIGNYTYKKVYLYFTIHRQPLDPNSFRLKETEFVYNKKRIEPEVLCSNENYHLNSTYKVTYYNNIQPDGNSYAYISGTPNYYADIYLPFHISKLHIDEECYIYMGDEPVKYDVYNPDFFAVKFKDSDEDLVMYDDFIYDFKTITFEKNTTYNYTIYVVTGIGPCTGTIVKGFRTSVKGYIPEIPQFTPRESDLISEEVDTPVVIISDDTEQQSTEIKPQPAYVDPYAKSDNWVPDVNPVIPDDPEGEEFRSGQFIYVRYCRYYSSPYTKYPEHDLVNGTFYIYHYKKVNDKIRVTLDPRNAKIVGKNVGWIPLEDIRDVIRLKIGDKVHVNGGFIYYDKYTLESRIFVKEDKDLFVTEIDSELPSTSTVGIGLGYKQNQSTVGWASLDMIDLVK